MSPRHRPRLDNEIQAELESRIAEGVYGPGDALLPEHALAAELGVSRMTLRQALKSLEDDGVLIRRHGIGTFVAPPTPVLECVLHENLGVTEMIQRSGLVAGTSQVVALDSIGDPYAAGQLACSIEDLVGLDRTRTASGRPVVATTDIFARQLVGNMSALQTLEGSLYEYLEMTFGLVVSRGSAVLIPAKATPAVSARLGIPRGSSVLLLEQTDFDSAGRPLVFSREYWIRHAIRFVVDRHGGSSPSSRRRQRGASRPAGHG